MRPVRLHGEIKFLRCRQPKIKALLDPSLLNHKLIRRCADDIKFIFHRKRGFNVYLLIRYRVYGLIALAYMQPRFIDRKICVNGAFRRPMHIRFKTGIGWSLFFI